MSIIFGFGIENETVLSFTDKNRVNRNYMAEKSSKIKLSDVYYHHDVQSWNKDGGWKRTVEGNDPILLSGDGSVTGNARGARHGFEVQTTDSHSKNVLPKDAIKSLFLALNDLAKEVNGEDNVPFKTMNPFGTAIGFDKRAVGSYHLNITFPFDDTKLDDAAYVKKYKDKGYKGFRVIRAIQPLFYAMIGGADKSSVGGIKYAEGSSRQAYNGYSNMGNVGLTSATFKREWYNEASGHFKGGDSNPEWRDMIEEMVDDTSGHTGWGDINPRHFPNIPRKINSVEFRFLDPFFTPNLYEVLKVVIAAMEHGKNVGAIEDAKDTEVWNIAATQCISEGWNARLSKEYQEMLKTKLGITLSVKDGKRADLIFNEVAKQLWEKNKTGFWVKHMFDEYSAPKVMNLNRYSWDMQFRYKYVTNELFEKYVDKFLTELKNIDASASNGWIRVTFDDTGKLVIRDLIMKDETFGEEIGTEDYGDMLFLLERIGAVKLKTNTAGHITDLKVLYTDPKTAMVALDNLQTIPGVEESYFGQETVEVEEEIPEPTPAPTVSGGRRVAISTSEAINIDMSRLSITTVPMSRDSTIYYNARDIEAMFEAANFLALDGASYRYEVQAAKITYEGRNLPVFWTRNAHRVTIYLDKDIFSEDLDAPELIDKLRHGFYSSRSVERSMHWMPDLTLNDFFGKLELIANNFKGRGRQGGSGTRIELDKAGLERLKQYGLRIASLRRGQRYYIVDKRKNAMLKRQFGQEINLIKYVPYQKNVYVQKFGGEFRLIQENKIIDKIGGRIE